MEPGMECADLMRLQRYAAIDFGINMQFDPADLTILPTSYSRALKPFSSKWTMRPRGPQVGLMLYVQLGDDRHRAPLRPGLSPGTPRFPHQTTEIKFYDEASLKPTDARECAIATPVREEITGNAAPSTVRDWFQHWRVISCQIMTRHFQRTP